MIEYVGPGWIHGCQIETIVRNGVCYHRLISRPTPSKCPVHSKTVYNAISSLRVPDPSRSRHPRPRTLDKVRTEMSLHVLAYNLKRMISMFGAGPLMAAIRT